MEVWSCAIVFPLTSKQVVLVTTTTPPIVSVSVAPQAIPPGASMTADGEGEAVVGRGLTGTGEMGATTLPGGAFGGLGERGEGTG
jgi:hypothetical protein